MEATATIIVLFLILFPALFAIPAFSADRCEPDSCDAGFGPDIRFPFRLRGRSPARCGYPGFDLHCDAQNRTILRLPDSGEFVVDHIDYSEQALFINDDESCLPARILNFSLRDSPFTGAYTRNYTFYNCSSDHNNLTSNNFPSLGCLSGANRTVLAVNPRSVVAPDVPPTCRPFATVSVPLQWTMAQLDWPPVDLREDLQLAWREPSCGECVTEGGVCGFQRDSGLQIACFRASRTVLPRGVMYGIIVGVGIPGLVCMIGLSCYTCGILRSLSLRRGGADSTLPISSSERLSVIRSAHGLDRPTIESYPTTILGKSCRFPEKSDGTCPICLSDYKPKEMLRSIPECNHCFHVNCIDEWLKLNGTCPVCRNSPEDSAASLFSPASVVLSVSPPRSSVSGTTDSH